MQRSACNETKSWQSAGSNMALLARKNRRLHMSVMFCGYQSSNLPTLWYLRSHWRRRKRWARTVWQVPELHTARPRAYDCSVLCLFRFRRTPAEQYFRAQDDLETRISGSSTSSDRVISRPTQKLHVAASLIDHDIDSSIKVRSGWKHCKSVPRNRRLVVG